MDRIPIENSDTVAVDQVVRIKGLLYRIVEKIRDIIGVIPYTGTPPEHVQDVGVVLGQTIRSLERVVHKACGVCNAPGVYKYPQGQQEIEWFAKWPEVCVDRFDDRLNMPVGENCPHCGSRRVQPEYLPDIVFDRSA